MLSAPRQVLTTMLATGIILAPLALATSPAFQDLADLRTVINAAAAQIGDANNPNRGFGFGFGASGQMDTADLVNNITTSILRGKFQLDTNQTSWLLPPPTTPPSTNITTPPPPTLPLTSSIPLPTTLPTSLPTLNTNTTTDLSPPYTDYISSLPNLSASLTTLGRAWHREMNSPVRDAIASLQQGISTLQVAMLQSELLGTAAVLRTIRASAALESAQEAWGRSLNLPGRGSAGAGDVVVVVRRDADGGGQGKRPLPAKGGYYTHQELWGRKFVA
ncbi:hypothetical protein P153DRAFT_402409 [Dothidotthia symphoricarpi CBS 119687]|uniref:Cell wall protein n=1 Tax=Dothidotthia symphoricarpi CBS 119687 TaxID=1392245 RepID=A0A6A6ATV9_9PLEO|nr:uncharacterized protein P153DRAFT_402409 [Dothidotthia symphoricarpi CBS 119687]KAF2134643.1 hypothetical protein P153DRAFT_402409 [Dothidotthia symphoricarpi CBS 119687]